MSIPSIKQAAPRWSAQYHMTAGDMDTGEFWVQAATRDEATRKAVEALYGCYGRCVSFTLGVRKVPFWR